MVRGRNLKNGRLLKVAQLDSEKNFATHKQLEGSSDSTTSLVPESSALLSTPIVETLETLPPRKTSILGRVCASLRSFILIFGFPKVYFSRRKQTQKSEAELDQNSTRKCRKKRSHYDAGIKSSRRSVGNLRLERQCCEPPNPSVFNISDDGDGAEKHADMNYFNKTFRPPTAFGPYLDVSQDEEFYYSPRARTPFETQDKERRSSLMKLPPAQPPSSARRKERLAYSNPTKPGFRSTLGLLNPRVDHSTSLGTLQDLYMEDRTRLMSSSDSLGRISRPHMSNGIRGRRVPPGPTPTRTGNPHIIPTIDLPTRLGSYRENFHRQMKLAHSVCNGVTPIPAEQMMKMLQLEEGDDEESMENRLEFEGCVSKFHRNIADFRNCGSQFLENGTSYFNWDDAATIYFPLHSSIPTRKGPSFPLFERKVNISKIEGKHIRAKLNRLRMYELRLEDKQFQQERWEKRRIIGLFKKKLREENNLQSMKICEELESQFHHINWLSSGKGNLNYVGRYFDLAENRLVAIKIYGYGLAINEAQRLQSKISAMAEINSLVQIECANVVQMLTYFELNSRIHMVMEACDHSLRSELEKAVKGVHPNMAQGIIRQVVIGLDFCHNLGCLHCDISPDNILVTSDGIVKLADFEKSIFLTNDEKQPCPTPGTIAYAAPELLIRSSEYGLTADIWSLGCLLGELLKGIPLWKYSTEVEQLNQIQNTFGATVHQKPSVVTYSSSVRKGERSLREMFPRISEDAFLFVGRCLEIDPKKRSTCEGLLHLNFLKYNREKVEAKRINQPMAEAILPRIELWSLRPHSAPLSFNLEEVPENIFDSINLNPYCTQNETPFTVTVTESESFCAEVDSVVPQDEKEKKRKKARSTTTKTKNVPVENVETTLPTKQISTPSWNKPLKRQYVQMNVQEAMNQSCYDSSSDSCSQVPSILKKGESKTTRKKAMPAKVTFAEDSGPTSQVPSSFICAAAAQSQNENPMLSLNEPKTPRAMMKEIINSVRCSSWNTIEVYTSNLRRVHQSSPKLFAAHIGSLVGVLLDQIAVSKSKVAGPPVRILRTIYDFAPNLLESDIERIVPAMLSKLGGPYFIDTECCDILQQIIIHSNPIRVSLALVRAGVKQSLGVGRAASGKYLCDAIRKLNFIDDIGDATVSQRRLASHIFDAATRFTRDTHTSTKEMGKEIFRHLLPHPQFWRLYLANVQEDQRNRINPLLDEIRRLNPALDEIRRAMRP